MGLIMAGCAVAFFSVLAFWKLYPVLFMIAGGASMMLGLAWFDTYGTNLGLSISLMIILYSLVCIAFAFWTMFKKKKSA